MSELKKRHPKRSDSEWISLIQECRTSGMTDKSWCVAHQIQPSKFYYHIRRLRAKACDLPDNPKVQSQIVHHEIVKIDLNESDTIDQTAPISKSKEQPLSTELINPQAAGETASVLLNSEPAIQLVIGRFTVEIRNSAERDTIIRTLSALQTLC